MIYAPEHQTVGGDSLGLRDFMLKMLVFDAYKAIIQNKRSGRVVHQTKSFHICKSRNIACQVSAIKDFDQFIWIIDTLICPRSSKKATFILPVLHAACPKGQVPSGVNSRTTSFGVLSYQGEPASVI